MPIIDTTKKILKDDRDETQSIGFKLPIELDNEYDSLTQDTLDAVKQNVLNLCSTEMGERVMQPTLGIRLKRFLFEPFSEDIVVQVQDTIIESMNYWLPFVVVKNIDVKMSDNQSGDFASLMEVSVAFGLKKDPSSFESVQVIIGE